jgi:S-DNA-T family DNA segregation ATPase FtsK/SpoIIIE
MTDDIIDVPLPLEQGGRRDAETVTVYDAVQGEPVDEPAAAMQITWSDVTKSKPGERPPLIPAWLRSRTQGVATMRQMGGNVGYYLTFHALRSPKYAIKTALYALPGTFRTLYRVGHWAAAEEGNAHLRQHAARSNDAHTWMALDKSRAKASNSRWWVVGLLAAPVVIGLLTVWGMHLVPTWAWQAFWIGMIMTCARYGRPADKPIIDRVTHAKRFTKLTAEMVRNAVVSIGVPGIKEPSDIEFPPPGIHRDGPGWLALFNVKPGVEAVEVLEKRNRLSSALRLPVDQVWPSAGGDHAGQVALWVGYQPASQMGQPEWKLAMRNATASVFEPNPFGHDERQRAIDIVLFENNALIGGQPGSGKSYGLRTLVTIAALDPTCELKIAEFKGTGDFMDFAPMCSGYVCGVDDDSMQAGADIIGWALAECERRGKRIKKFREQGLAPLGKVTPELARRKGSGLHPIVIAMDEVHELFGWDPDAAKNAERAIKRGRALGIIFLLATQIPDKTSLPPGITRCVSIRWCMSVVGQIENDMILGTGAYKRGLTGTAYRPRVDGGWGVMTGLERPTSVRSFFPDQKTTAAIIGRAPEVRGGVVATDDGPKLRVRNLLEDVHAVVGRDAGLPWEVLAERLRELDREVYRGMTGDMLREAMRRYDVSSQNVKVRDESVEGGWRTLKGARRTEIEAALERQRIEGDSRPEIGG